MKLPDTETVLLFAWITGMVVFLSVQANGCETSKIALETDGNLRVQTMQSERAENEARYKADTEKKAARAMWLGNCLAARANNRWEQRHVDENDCHYWARMAWDGATPRPTIEAKAEGLEP